MSVLTFRPNAVISCYVTSKRRHATMLLTERANWPHIHFTARWPAIRDVSSEQATPSRIWTRDNADDISRSDVVVCYAVPEDELNTSIFEVGQAWNQGKPIYLIGENVDYKEWTHARGIKTFKKKEDAFTAIQNLVADQPNMADQIMQYVKKSRPIPVAVAIPGSHPKGSYLNPIFLDGPLPDNFPDEFKDRSHIYVCPKGGELTKWYRSYGDYVSG